MTYKQLNASYAVLAKAWCDVRGTGDASKHEKYTRQVDVFTSQLRKILTDKRALKHLTKRQTWQVLAWCSAYRPEPQNVTIRTFGSLIDE